MEESKIGYQASIFADAQQLKPTPESISRLLSDFGEFGLIPTTYHEGVLGSLAPASRIRMASPDGETSIDIGQQRIDVEKNPLDPAGNNLGSVEEFCSIASNLHRKMIRHLKSPGHRATFVSKYLLRDIDPKCLPNAAPRLFHMPLFFKEEKPFEWFWRLASNHRIRISKAQSEDINVIVTISRSRGVMSSVQNSIEFEGLLVTIDLNTVAPSTQPRFNAKLINGFYQAIPEFHDRLKTEIRDFINEALT